MKGSVFMKKLVYFIICAMTVLSLTPEFCYGDNPPLFHVVIASIEEITGGNSRISYTPVDFRTGASNKEAFAHLKYEYNQAHPSYKGNAAYGSILQPQGSGVRKPAAKIPTEKTGLLNAKNPINIISYSDNVFFAFDNEEHQMWLSSSVRILDNKGKVLASLNKYDDTAKIKVPSKAEKYYVELSKNDNGTSEYFYILLSIRATDIKPAYSARIAKQEADSAEQARKQYEEVLSVEQAYMKRQGIKSRENLTDSDIANIAEELRKKQYEDDNDSGIDFNELSELPPEIRMVIEPYMKKHGITKMRDLTIQDWQTLQPELEKVSGSKEIKTKKKRK